MLVLNSKDFIDEGIRKLMRGFVLSQVKLTVNY